MHVLTEDEEDRERYKCVLGRMAYLMSGVQVKMQYDVWFEQTTPKSWAIRVPIGRRQYISSALHLHSHFPSRRCHCAPYSFHCIKTTTSMGRLRKKGEAGAAKAYVTRSAAIKKLQCSLADFRRLCILKGEQILLHICSILNRNCTGIFPREPRNKKKANKGSSASTSFYYAKDIAYLAHEPVLQKLREHKAFAKKLARALGRGEWSSAKSLEEHKPTYRLDHIIKERCVKSSANPIALANL